MTILEIECFLSICEHKTVSRAAEALYITQPSLSSRLKTLERELGGELFVRRKGSREMMLTVAGKEFYALALQYEELMGQMYSVFNKPLQKLRVSSLNSLDTFLLPQVYELFLQQNPEIELEIQDMELPLASRNIHNGDTDIAFTTGNNKDKMLKQTLVFVEPMVLLCGGELAFNAPVTVKELLNSQELYVDWSSGFSKWHNETFGEKHPKLTVAIMSHLKQFLQSKSCWAIVPASVAEGLKDSNKIKRVDTVFKIPERKVSIITSLESKNNAINCFSDCIKEVVSKYDEIDVKI